MTQLVHLTITLLAALGAAVWLAGGCLWLGYHLYEWRRRITWRAK